MTVSIVNAPTIIAPGVIPQIQFVDDAPQNGRRYDLVGALSGGDLVDIASSVTLSPLTPNSLPSSGLYDFVVRYQVTAGDWSETEDSEKVTIFIGEECDLTAVRNTDGTVTFTNNEAETVTFTAAGAEQTLNGGETLANLAGVTEQYILCRLSAGQTGGGGTGTCTAGLGKFFGASSGIKTLANMKNWTNGDFAISFTNVDHTSIDSVRFHTTARTSSYYNGNGGTFKVHLRDDDGTGKPGPNILASSANYIGATTSTPSSGNPWGNSRSAAESAYPNALYESFNESGRQLEYHRRYSFLSAANVVPGQRYHIIMERTTSTSHGVSLNGYLSDEQSKYDDPCFDDKDWRIHAFNGGQWVLLPHKPIFEAIGNGMTIGCTCVEDATASTESDLNHDLTGGDSARQLWIPHKTMQIGAVRVSCSRRSGSAPVTCTIRNSGGTALATTTISGFPNAFSGNNSAVRREVAGANARRQGTFTPITVTQGQTYYIEFSTSSGTHYEIHLSRDGILSNYYDVDPEYHGWGPNARAEVRKDGGGWVLPVNWGNSQDYCSVEAEVVQYANGSTSCLEDQCAINGGTSLGPQTATTITDAVGEDKFDVTSIQLPDILPGQTGEEDVTDLIQSLAGDLMNEMLAKLATGDSDDHVYRVVNTASGPRIFRNIDAALATGQTSVDVDLQ